MRLSSEQGGLARAYRWMGLTALALGLVAVWPGVAAGQPNIIVILADDLGNSDISAYNPLATPLVNTPALDQLAADGIRFTDGRTPDGVCTPTRYGLLTGQYSWRTELKSLVQYGYDDPLIPNDRETLASMLKTQGYNTAIIGKWHLGVDWVDANGNPTTNANNVDFTKPTINGPNTVGFDESVIISASLDMAPYGYIRNGQMSQMDGSPITNRDTQMTNADHPDPDFGGVSTRDGWTVNGFDFSDVMPTLGQESAGYIQQQATDGSDDPFFMYVPLTGPHTPIVPTDGSQGTNPGAGTYGAFMNDVDQTVATIVNAVDAQGQEFADNTLIIFAADNGAHRLVFGPGGQHEANAPYRDKKLSVYDGGVRVPFIARWGGQVAPGQVIDERVGLIDLYGTFADLSGYELSADEAEDTASFANMLLHGDYSPIREGHIYHSYRGSFAIGSDQWKLFTDAQGGAGGAQPDPSSWQLYNLDTDVDESDNLVNLHPNKAVELGLMIARYEPNAETGRSRTHRQMLARFDLIGFQAGHDATAANPDVHELTTTSRLAQGVAIAQGLKKGAGLTYVDDAPVGGGPQTLLDDPFDDGDPATGGTSGGFQLQRNTTDSDHTLTEAAGQLTGTLTETTFQSPNGGPVSINPFGSASGVTITFEVDSVSAQPTHNGMFVGVVDTNTGFYRNLDNVGFSFFGSDSKQGSAGGFSFLVNDKDGAFDILDSGANLNWNDLADGFTAQMTLAPDGWSYVLTGAAGSTITNAGTWSGANPYAAVLDGQDYAVASYQNGDADNDTFVLNRVTVTTPDASQATRDRGDEFHLAGFEATSLADAKTQNDYVSFAFDIDEDQSAQDLLISFDLWRDSADSATHYALLTSADGFTDAIGEVVFTVGEHGINLGNDYTGGEYGTGNAKTLTALLDLPEGVAGQLEVRIYGYSDGQSLDGSTHLIAARVEGLLDFITIPGDIDGDGEVDQNDLGLLLNSWGASVPAATAGDWSADGIINLEDLTLTLRNWTGTTPPDLSVPEPGSAAALLILAAGQTRYRRATAK